MKKVLFAITLGVALGNAAAARYHRGQHEALRAKVEKIDYRCDACPRPVYQYDMENLSEYCKEHSGK